jgi:hypothetical protein
MEITFIVEESEGGKEEEEVDSRVRVRVFSCVVL